MEKGDGRFVIRLQFKSDLSIMGPSNKMAFKRFYSHIISQVQNFLSEIFLLMNENIHK
jgi:hypothetical protein